MAIEIDEKCVEAYIGAADAYIGVGQPQKARKILEIGFDKTTDKSISDKLDEIESLNKDTSSKNRVVFESEEMTRETQSSLEGMQMTLSLTDPNLREYYPINKP